MMPGKQQQVLAVKAGIWFALSTIITWLFIVVAPMYFSKQQQLLSCVVAGGKWGIQILAAFFFSGAGKWFFLERIGFTCFIGSVILLPYYISSISGINNSPQFFVASLIVAVLVMIYFYYRGVKQSGLGLNWWLGWLVCLATAITLQLTVVFHVI